VITDLPFRWKYSVIFMLVLHKTSCGVPNHTSNSIMENGWPMFFLGTTPQAQ
jgi:hypothetical protein